MRERRHEPCQHSGQIAVSYPKSWNWFMRE